MGKETSPEGDSPNSSADLWGIFTLAQGLSLPRGYRGALDSQVRLQPNLRGGPGVRR